MKRNYLGIWLLLLAAFVVVAALSAFSPVSIGDYELRDSGLADALTAPRGDNTADPAARTDSPSAADSVFDRQMQQMQAPVDSSAKVLLFIGDSMLEGLSPRLAAYAKHNGHTLYSVIWYSSTSEVWGRSGKLKHYVEQIKPDFVFISLGANELFVKDIKTKRDKYVKTLISELGDTPYLWIGPPNWKPDTGINDLVRANTGRGCFFLSDGMHFERAKDGAHPTRTSAALWMDSVVRWMGDNCPTPFLLDVPSVNTASPKRIFIHQPNEQ